MIETIKIKRCSICKGEVPKECDGRIWVEENDRKDEYCSGQLKKGNGPGWCLKIRKIHMCPHCKKAWDFYSKGTVYDGEERPRKYEQCDECGEIYKILENVRTQPMYEYVMGHGCSWWIFLKEKK